MKKIILLVAFIGAAFAIFANPITPQQAKTVALNFMILNTNSATKSSSCNLIYTQKTANKADFYVFQIGNGFTIVAADDAVQPILGYSPNRKFVSENIPKNTKLLLQSYADEISYIRSKNNVTATASTTSQWQYLLQDEIPQLQRSGSISVEPLLTTSWDQSPYYNKFCPDYGTNITYTGCVATALAQIINYYQYPAKGYGTHSYTHEIYGLQSADFENTTYQYSLMPQELDENSSTTAIDAIATLMYQCGVAVNMNYGTDGSSAFDVAARAALVNHFDYDAQILLKSYKTPGMILGTWNNYVYYDDETWIELLKSELDAQRPIYYSGNGNSGGHAFVCDGYDANNLFHINWGWGGAYNGYFAIGSLYPYGDDNQDMDFNNYNQVIFAQPRTTGTQLYVLNRDGHTSMNVSGTLEITHALGQNKEYLYTDKWGENNLDTLTLYPNTAGGQVLLEKINFANQYSNGFKVYVYDGEDETGNLLMTVNNGSVIEPVISTTGALTLVATGLGTINNELLLRATEVQCLPVVMGFECSKISFANAEFGWNVFQEENYQEHNFNFQLEYGLHGFSLGNGTKINSNSTSCMIGNLTAETDYDAYLHYNCTNGQTITLGPVSFTTTEVSNCFENPVVGGNAVNSAAFGGAYYSWAQQIYTAEELHQYGLEAGDEIVSLSIQYGSTNNFGSNRYRNIAVYMGNTEKNAFNNSTDWFDVGNLVNVFPDSGILFKKIIEDEWIDFHFASPFVWDGESNIVIAFADSNINFTDYFYFKSNYTQDNKLLIGQYYDNPFNASYDGQLANYRANVRFCVGEDCIKPSNIIATSDSPSSLTIEWFPGYQETSWIVEYGKAGFELGTGTTLTVNNTPNVTISQLSSGYYDVYVQANCGQSISKRAKATINTSDLLCSQIGTENDHQAFPLIAHNYYGYDYTNEKNSYVQELFTASDLTEMGFTSGDKIHSIALQYGGNPQDKSSVSIYIGHSNVNYFSYQSNKFLSANAMQKVFNGSIRLEEGWVRFNFDEPFVWNGTSSIVVGFLDNSNTQAEGECYFVSSYSESRRSVGAYSSEEIDIHNVTIQESSFQRSNMIFCKSNKKTLNRDMEVVISEGETYNFYGRELNEQGKYAHSWYVNEESDSLVSLNLIIRKIFYVTTTGSGAKNGSSWANAMDLQAAMDTASTFHNVTSFLYVKKGTYPGDATSENSFEIKPNVRAYGGFNGNEPADFDLNNRNISANQTILLGSNLRRVLYQSEDFTESTASSFDGFIIRNGTVNSAQYGGGAYIRKYCTLNNCKITANNASISGNENNIDRRGIAVYNAGGTISNCEIYSNTISLSGTASGHKIYGVGIYNQGTVTDCNIHNNVAIYDGDGNNWQVYGGGVYNSYGSITQNCTIAGNSASTGGGIYQANTDIDIPLFNNIISNNTSRGDGGGIYTTAYHSPAFVQCLISNNSSGARGGGIYAISTTILKSCNVVRNSAVTSGGGISGPNMTIQNSIIWGNKVGATLNQIHSHSNAYRFTFQSSALQGGYSGAITLEAENSGNGIGYPMFTNPTTEAGVDVNNAIGDWTLQNGSVCINLGNNDFADDVETDLNGNERIQQQHIDIGAFESSLQTAHPINPETESNIIYVTNTGAGSQDGSSWTNATSNLQYAMEVATGNNPASVIWMKNGNYHFGKTLIIQPNVAVYGGFIGNEPNNYNLSLRDFDANPTILDGDSAFRIIEQSCSFETSESSDNQESASNFGILDGLSFQNGYSEINYGGAYFIDNIEIRNCSFKNNHNTAVYAKKCKFSNSTFDNNDGCGLAGENLTTTSCSASGNSDYGFWVSNNSTVDSCVFTNNRGGIRVGWNCKINNCFISENGNNQTYSYHRALYSVSSQVTNTSIINNNCSGLYAEGGLFVNVNIANNTSTINSYAAGVSAVSNARFVNCNIVNNKSASQNEDDNLRGGIYNISSDNEYTNCIIWGNKSNNEVGNIYSEAIFSYCAIEGGKEGIANINLASANIGTDNDSNYVAFSNPGAEAGVSTQINIDYKLSAGSACINMGNPNTTSLNLPLYDLDGSLRIKQQHIDIGAYEFGDVTLQIINDTICLGESFFFEDYFVYPEQVGLFTDTFIYYQAGNDYIANINLLVNEVYNLNIEKSICEGESFFFNNQSYTESGTYTAYLQSAFGCDSTVVLNLTVNPTLYNEFSAEACEVYVWNGIEYTNSGNFTQTLSSATGCDSTVTLHLTIHHNAASDDYLTLCRSALPYTYGNTVFGINTPEKDTIQCVMQTIHGCDSIVTVYLSVVDVINKELNEIACDSYEWNGINYTTSGDKVQTFTAVSGCDSVVTLHLTINHSNSGTEIVNACDSYTWIDGITYTETPATAPVYTISNSAGCDSIVTLNLKINHSSTNQITVTECDNVTLNGITYSESGIYTQTLVNATGCDSILTLNLTIHNSAATDDYVTICENELPYAYNDTIFAIGTENSVHQFHLNTINGCDSLVTLHLTVIPQVTPTINVSGYVSACESGTATLSVDGNFTAYNWSTGATSNTVSVTTAGYYWVEVTDENGCTFASEMLQLGASDLIEETPAICMVGVENNHNLIIWEPLEDEDVTNYKIYRENDQANVYELLAIVPAQTTNAFEDETANPEIRAYRYKISAEDTCGGETPMSNFHKTIHLTINQGLGNSWNLIWTPYEGFEFASYNLYRGTANNDLQLIQTMPSNLTSFTDLNASNDALFYQIEVVKEENCTQITRDNVFSGARSNIVYNGIAVETEFSEDACESYTWNNQILTSSGDYQQTFVSELGYDSLVTLHLTIYQTPNITISGNTTILVDESTTLSVQNDSQWSYLWSTGATTNSINVSPTENTTYTVTATYGACTASDSVTVIITSIEEFENDKYITVYPNPTDGISKIKIVSKAQISDLQLFDNNGKLLKYIKPTSEFSEIDLSNFASGIYYLKFYDNSKLVAVKKIVKR